MTAIDNQEKSSTTMVATATSSTTTMTTATIGENQKQNPSFESSQHHSPRGMLSSADSSSGSSSSSQPSNQTSKTFEGTYKKEKVHPRKRIELTLENNKNNTKPTAPAIVVEDDDENVDVYSLSSVSIEGSTSHSMMTGRNNIDCTSPTSIMATSKERRKKNRKKKDGNKGTTEDTKKGDGDILLRHTTRNRKIRRTPSRELIASRLYRKNDYSSTTSTSGTMTSEEKQSKLVALRASRRAHERNFRAMLQGGSSVTTRTSLSDADPDSQTTAPCRPKKHEPEVYDDLKAELVSAFEVIRQQQQLIQTLREGVGGRGDINFDRSGPTASNDDNKNNDNDECDNDNDNGDNCDEDKDKIILDLKKRISISENERAMGELFLRGKISKDSLSYDNTIRYWKQESETWKNRFEKLWDDHQTQINYWKEMVYSSSSSSNNDDLDQGKIQKDYNNETKMDAVQTAELNRTVTRHPSDSPRLPPPPAVVMARATSEGSTLVYDDTSSKSSHGNKLLPFFQKPLLVPTVSSSSSTTLRSSADDTACSIQSNFLVQAMAKKHSRESVFQTQARGQREQGQGHEEQQQSTISRWFSTRRRSSSGPMMSIGSNTAVS